MLLVKGAATLAALDDRTEISPEDLEVAATVVLPHRLRRSPFDEHPISEDDIRDFAREAASLAQAEPEKKNATELAEVGNDSLNEGAAMGHNRHLHPGTQVTTIGNHRPMDTDQPDGLLAKGLWADQDITEEVLPLEGDPLPPPVGAPVAANQNSAARRQTSVRDTVSDIPFRGRYTRAIPAGGELTDLAWDATLRTSAHRQRQRSAPGGLAFDLRTDELLRRVRVRRPGRLFLFVVDISGSMASRLMVLAKNIALSVIQDAYIKRDQVAMIAFRQRSAEVLFWPTNQVGLVRRALDALPLGGTTPLGMGLEQAQRVLGTLRTRAPGRQEVMILISDGRANMGRRPGHEVLLAEVEAAARALAGTRGLRIVFLDTTASGKHDLPARRLARQLEAQRLQLSKIRRSGRDPVSELSKVLDLSTAAKMPGVGRRSG
jgi:magnesium chelatase subunit D